MIPEREALNDGRPDYHKRLVGLARSLAHRNLNTVAYPSQGSAQRMRDLVNQLCDAVEALAAPVARPSADREAIARIIYNTWSDPGFLPWVPRDNSSKQEDARRAADAILSRVSRADAAESAERLAQRFHETYERLAPDFGYETREASRRPWSEVPESNCRLMTAVCAELLAAAPRPEDR
jgi:hypothetical protein